MSTSERPDKEKRSKNGCGLCRARRIKCDEVHPACGQCVKRGFDCVYDPGAAAKVDINSALARRRSRAACTSCRNLKRRCTPAEDDNRICSRCKRLGLHCEWQPSKHRSTDTSGRRARSQDEDSFDQDLGSVYDHPSGSLSPDAGPLGGNSQPRAGVRLQERSMSPGARSRKVPKPNIPSFDEMAGNKVHLHMLVQTFFGTVHQYGFLTFVHEPSFFKLLDRGKAPLLLTKIIVACALRFAGDLTPPTFRQADMIYDEAFSELRDQMYEGFGAIELMATLLAQAYDHARGNFYSSWMMWGNAVRIMQFLSLHSFDETYPQPHAIRLSPLLKPEALRRLAWAVFYLDTMADAGRHGIHTVTETGYHLQLPADEASFASGVDVITMPLEKHPSSKNPSASMPWESPAGQNGTGSATPGSGSVTLSVPPQAPHSQPASNPKLGIGSNLIRTAAMRRRILHFNSLLKYSLASPSQMINSLALLDRDLRAVIIDLPQDLSYSEENLQLHSKFRTMFVLLHMMRHNCFLMLLWAKLNVASRCPDPPETTQTLMQERLRHAFGVAGIVGDAVRLGVNCDPFVGVQAYTSLEVLLFDPLRLLNLDSTIEPKHPRFAKALAPLLELMRRLSPVDAMMNHLRVEACRRLARCGFGDVLVHADWEACKRHPNTGQTDSEFDFRFFKWHRVEKARQHRHSVGTSQAAEALLDLGSLTANPSRAATPEADELPTNNLFGPDDYAVSPPDFERAISKALPGYGHLEQGAQPDQGSDQGLPHTSIPILPQHPGGQIGSHGLSSTLGEYPGLGAAQPGLSPEDRRWATLDFHPRPILPATGLTESPFDMDTAFGGLMGGLMGPTETDDLDGFLDHAGLAAQEADPFGWLGLNEGDRGHGE